MCRSLPLLLALIVRLLEKPAVLLVRFQDAPLKGALFFLRKEDIHCCGKRKWPEGSCSMSFHGQDPSTLSFENEKEDAMSQQEQRPLRGTEAEIYERYLVPAVFAPWATLLIEQAALQPGVSLAWQEGNAIAMPFADASFDALLCQQGLQFFPERPAALREMHRVLVPGGRVVLSMWGPLEGNPGHAALVVALQGHLATAAASAIRSFFALGAAWEVRSLLAGGPFHEVQLHTATRTVRFASPEQFVRIEMIPSRPESPLAGMDERALSVLISEVNTALQPYVGPDGLAFPMQAHLVTAQK